SCQSDQLRTNWRLEGVLAERQHLEDWPASVSCRSIGAAQIRFNKVRSAQIPAIQIHGTQIRNVTWILFSQGIPGLNIISEHSFLPIWRIEQRCGSGSTLARGALWPPLGGEARAETRMVTLIQRVR